MSRSHGWLGTALALAILVLSSVPVLAAAPSEVWVRLFNGAGNDLDHATSVAVGAGYVVVTGQSRGSGTGTDYATVKYDLNGNPLWVPPSRTYNGPENGIDLGRSVAVDGAGSIYVTGLSDTGGTPAYVATIKYASNGQELWVARYDAGYSEVARLAVDGAGNVYVVGGTFTLKYSTDGVLQWAASFDAGAGLAKSVKVDGLGNVYVTGWSGIPSDIVTSKYSNAGTQLWVAHYSNGKGRDLAVDALGNVYVTGSVENSGTASDYATLKYDAGGTLQWAKSYTGLGGAASDWAVAIAIDGQARITVTGVSAGSGNNDTDIATVQYDSSGSQRWVKRYGGGGACCTDDAGNAIAVDGSDNVIVTGKVAITKRGKTSRDVATIKYNSGGSQRWVKTYDDAQQDDDVGSAIAVDGSGSSYVAGAVHWNSTAADYVTIKYAP